MQGERNFNRFGGWLGKNSTWGKNYRLLEGLHVHVLASRICEPTREALRLDYLPVFMLKLTNPLRSLSKEEGVQTVVKFMDEYSTNQEDVETIVDLCKFQGRPNPYDGVPSAVKSALTKHINNMSSVIVFGQLIYCRLFSFLVKRRHQSQKELLLF